MKRTLIGLVLAAMLFPASAHAGAPVAWQRKALATAERVWHPQACGPLRIQWANPKDFGGTELWGGWAYAGDCNIYEPADRAWLGYPDFCTAVLHEAGHVAGMGHAARGIMKAERQVIRTQAVIGRKTYTRWAGVDRRCLPAQVK